MALTTLAKKLFRTLARVIPQCGMVSQAVAFNMFLAFFAVLVTALREEKPEVAREELAELVREFPRNALFASELAKVEAAPGAAVPLP
jgi:hypothetical protein